MSSPTPAPLGRRALAALIDGLPLILAGAGVAAIVLSSQVELANGRTGYPKDTIAAANGLALVVATAWFIYMTVASRRGRTLGKHLMGLRVLTLEGERITWQTAFLREGVFKVIAPFIITGLVLPQALLLLPVFLAAPMLWHRRLRRAAHDVLAGTIVVDERAQEGK